tara:strand:+ start:146 stop:601 length:456 start_codon:yes stop_codon:yes gene_type:complete
MLIATKNEKISLSSENETEELAIIISKKIKLGDIIFLHGEMGVGKTTFIKYLVNSFQKKNKLRQTEVTSPTFNILIEYQINKIMINHYDLFRLKFSDELKNLGLFENRSNSITLVEWPQIINEKPNNLIELFFKYEDNHLNRSVKIKGLDL